MEKRSSCAASSRARSAACSRSSSPASSPSRRSSRRSTTRPAGTRPRTRSQGRRAGGRRRGTRCSAAASRPTSASASGWSSSGWRWAVLRGRLLPAYAGAGNAAAAHPGAAGRRRGFLNPLPGAVPEVPGQPAGHRPRGDDRTAQRPVPDHGRGRPSLFLIGAVVLARRLAAQVRHVERDALAGGGVHRRDGRRHGDAAVAGPSPVERRPTGAGHRDPPAAARQDGHRLPGLPGRRAVPVPPVLGRSQVILWTAIGLAFAPLAERCSPPAPRSAPASDAGRPAPTATAA